MESISTEKELSIYHLDRKWNDYVGVQKEVLRVLREEKLFEQNEVVNRQSVSIVAFITPLYIHNSLTLSAKCCNSSIDII